MEPDEFGGPSASRVADRHGVLTCVGANSTKTARSAHDRRYQCSAHLTRGESKNCQKRNSLAQSRKVPETRAGLIAFAIPHL